MKIKIGLSAIGVPFFFFTINQLILQFLKPAEQEVSVRLGFAMSPAIFGLFFAAALIILLIIFRILKPLLTFLSSGEDYDRARKASLRIPWLLILTNTGLWLAVITLFYGLQGFKTEGGVPFFWSLTTNSISGFESAVLAALLINRILIPGKIRLDMTDIREGERDIFVKIKFLLIFCSGFLYTVLIMGYGAKYYYVSGLMDYELIPFSFGLVVVFLSVFSSVPLLIGVILALGEDRIQRRYLQEKLNELTAGGGGLNRKVSLLNFDEIGEIAASINIFIGKIRDLVEKVDQTGRLVIETSSSVEEYVKELTGETGTMLDAVNSIDQDMEQQEEEFRHTKAALSEYFGAMEKITDNIEEQSASVEQTSSSIEELAASIKSVNTSAREVETLTGNLGSITSQGIVQIRDFINSIKSIESSSENVSGMLVHMKELSDNVDILAMNAAIEAAHAGDFGKGFAVVADEIKNLAEGSSEKTKEIGGHVDSMLLNIKTSNDRTVQAENAFEEIRTRVEETTVHFHTIFRAIEEESMGVEELLTTLSSLVGITENLRNIAADQKTGNREMDERIGGVFERFGRIRESINSQKNNRAAITEAMTGMKEIARKNLEIADELNDQLKGFSSGS